MPRYVQLKERKTDPLKPKFDKRFFVDLPVLYSERNIVYVLIWRTGRMISGSQLARTKHVNQQRKGCHIFAWPEPD